jgi:hypothetical protein
MSNYIVVGAAAYKNNKVGEEFCLSDFIEGCNDAISQGYHPVGGIQFHKDKVYQSFVKMPEPDFVGMAEAIAEHKERIAESINNSIETMAISQVSDPKSWLDDEATVEHNDQQFVKEAPHEGTISREESKAAVARAISQHRPTFGGLPAAALEEMEVEHKKKHKRGKR